MTDFVQSSLTKSALRELANSIASGNRTRNGSADTGGAGEGVCKRALTKSKKKTGNLE